jgi:hypothetical protein
MLLQKIQQVFSLGNAVYWYRLWSGYVVGNYLLLST